VCRYNWHSAGSLGRPFPIVKYSCIFQIKYTEAVLSTNTRKLLWFEITKMLIAVQEKNYLPFIIIFDTLLFPMPRRNFLSSDFFQLSKKKYTEFP